MILLGVLSYLVTTLQDLWNNTEEYPRFGRKQSPINIASENTEYDELLRSFPIEVDYKTEYRMTLLNTGHTLKANVIQSSTVSGGPFDDKYKLVQFHLHWGSTDLTGSEHTVEGRQLAAELHLVHYNSDRYDSIVDARDRPAGLAVLGVLLRVGKKHPIFNTIIDCIRDITDPQQTTCLPRRFNPRCLLPDDTYQYWTYPGSLTTPPYSETVTWVVFRQTVQVSHRQLEALRSLKCNYGHSGTDQIVDNFRNTCPLGGRTIKASFE